MSVQAQFFTKQGESKGMIDLPENIFGLSDLDNALVQEVFCALRSNRRQGTAKTKSRGEVRGGGIKPWRQKGTGRARAGSIRSPLWAGGGVIFGPRPRSFYVPVPKKKKRKAVQILLSSRAKEGKVFAFESLGLTQPKTKESRLLLNRVGLAGKKVLIVDNNFSKELVRAFKNLPQVRLVKTDSINVYDIITSDNIVITQEAIETFKGRFKE